MVSAFFRNRRWASWAYGAGAFLLLSIWLQVQMTVLLNNWYNVFYTLLQAPAGHGISEFWALIFSVGFQPHDFGFAVLPMPYSFLGIAVPYVLLATLTNFVTRHYGFRWRQAITEDYIPRWRNVAHEIEGASQRIQEDARDWASIIESLGLAIVRAILTLIAFVPILWSLSSKVDLPIIRDIPGSLVWASVATTIGGMVISWFVGWFLPGLEYNNQRAEAAFRKELVYGEDDKQKFAQPETLFQLFIGVRFSYFRLFLHKGYFDIWSNMFSQITSLTPLLMIGPGMFTGAVTFGLLNQVSDAYGRVDNAFGLILNNWTTLTQLRSIWRRLHEFEVNLDKYDTGQDVGVPPAGEGSAAE